MTCTRAGYTEQLQQEQGPEAMASHQGTTALVANAFSLRFADRAHEAAYQLHQRKNHATYEPWLLDVVRLMQCGA